MAKLIMVYVNRFEKPTGRDAEYLGDDDVSVDSSCVLLTPAEARVVCNAKEFVLSTSNTRWNCANSMGPVKPKTNRNIKIARLIQSW